MNWHSLSRAWQPIDKVPLPKKLMHVGIARFGSFARVAVLRDGEIVPEESDDLPPTHWVVLSSPEEWLRLSELAVAPTTDLTMGR